MKKQTNKQKKLSYDPSIPLLGMYPEKFTTRKETCTLRCTAALFTIGRTQKQPRRAYTDAWTKK